MTKPDVYARITVSANHGCEVGEIVDVHTGSEWSNMWELIKRPRIVYISAINGNCMSLSRRRMTWNEFMFEIKLRFEAILMRYCPLR
jgi:hypothetical protein